MATISEPNSLGDLLKHEAENFYSREKITVLAGSGSARTLPIGAVVGRRTKSSVVTAAVTGNTGNGTIGTATLGANAVPGIYALKCTAASTNAGTFSVITPSGNALVPLTVGIAYSSTHLNVTVADGSTDFIVGDSFTVTVSGDDKIVALDPAAVNGTQQVAGVIAAEIIAPDGTDASGVLIARHAILAEPALVWPSGITTGQKNTALAQLVALGIIVRKGV
ncbi:MAG: head decoration protein [Magnetococcales bacterium]|nr:head decoration protein [Magnetococcales bacterium]